MNSTDIPGLTVTPDSKEILLLGYPISLTDSERAILTFLLSNGSATKLQLSEICGNSAAVHICNINRKCREISGRHLIIHNRKAYIINNEL